MERSSSCEEMAQLPGRLRQTAHGNVHGIRASVTGVETPTAPLRSFAGLVILTSKLHERPTAIAALQIARIHRW